MSTKNDKEINWNEVIEKEALGVDGLDLGTIKEVRDEYIVTETGFLTKKKYHLPKSAVKYFNGVFLDLSINELDLVNYEQKEKVAFDDNSSYKSSDLSKEAETSIPLISEDLKVKKKILDDDVKIIKEPIKETKTVQIELMHEKVTIERNPINNISYKEVNLSSTDNPSLLSESNKDSELKGPVESKTEIMIPVKREEPIITKKPFIREEIIVKKKPETETKTISEEITKEEIRYHDNDIKK